MWNIDDNKIIFKSYKYEDNNVVCESNIQIQQISHRLEEYFNRLAYSSSDNVCINIADGEFKIIELDELEDGVRSYISYIEEECTDTDITNNYTYEISFKPFFKAYFKYDDGIVDESHYYFIVKTSKSAEKLFDYIAQESLVKDTTNLNTIIKNIEIYNVFDYSKPTINFIKRGFTAIKAAAFSGNAHRKYGISDDDFLGLFESHQHTSNSKSIDEFLNVYPSVISTYEKSHGTTVREQEIAHRQALNVLNNIIALDVHIRDSDVWVSFVSSSADDITILNSKYKFKKLDNYTAYCKTDTEHVFVFTDIKSFKPHIMSCIKQCKHKKHIIDTLNDSIEECDELLNLHLRDSLIYEKNHQTAGIKHNYISVEANKLLSQYTKLIMKMPDVIDAYNPIKEQQQFTNITTKLKPFVYTYLRSIFVYETQLHLLNQYTYNSKIQDDLKQEVIYKLNSICDWCAKLCKACIYLNYYLNDVTYDPEIMISDKNNDDIGYLWNNIKKFNTLQLSEKLKVINYFINYTHMSGTLLTSFDPDSAYFYVFGDDTSINDKITDINSRLIERDLEKQLGY